MGKMLYKWKCLECGSIVNHKGLCRDCTEYSKGGDIVKPVQRIKVDFDGNEALSVSNNINHNNYLNIDDLGKTTDPLRSGISSLVHWLK